MCWASATHDEDNIARNRSVLHFRQVGERAPTSTTGHASWTRRAASWDHCATSSMKHKQDDEHTPTSGPGHEPTCKMERLHPGAPPSSNMASVHLRSIPSKMASAHTCMRPRHKALARRHTSCRACTNWKKRCLSICASGKASDYKLPQELQCDWDKNKIINCLGAEM